MENALFDVNSRVVGKVMDITPTIAAKWIDENNSNNPRKTVNRNVVQAYATDMRNGNWVMNGEPIVIDANGEIKNGQHRLLAVIEAGVAVKMFVVIGISPDVTTFDMPLQRKVAQELGINQAVVTVAQTVINNCCSSSQNPRGTIKQYVIDHVDDIRTAVNMSCHGKVGNSALCNKRTVQLFIYLMIRNWANVNELDSFITSANSGFGIDGRECSSAVVLANYLRTNRVQTRTTYILKTMQTAYLAYRDFLVGKSRRKPYTINNTNDVEELMHKVRTADGLE